MASAVRNNQSGYSLIGVLITLGVMTTIASGTVTLIRQQLLEQGSERFLRQTLNIAEDTANILLNDVACSKTVIGGSGSIPLSENMNIQRSQILNENGDSLFEVGEIYNDRSVRLDDIRIAAYDDEEETVELRLHFVSLAQVTGKGQMYRKVFLDVTRTGLNMTGCRVKSNGSGGVWQKGAIPDSFYTTASVGIGTPSPQAALDVKGGFIRGQFECTRRASAPTVGVAVATCNADEYALSGGATCTDPKDYIPDGGYVVQSRPIDGNFNGWQADCYRTDRHLGGADAAYATAFAICCKR